jgi:hypoxanthine phosphoribosyltransferase
MVLSEEILVGDLSFTPFIRHKEIQTRIAELGLQINTDFEEKVPIFIPVLNGAFMFAADLLKQICIPCEVSFVKVTSYHGTNSSGEVEEILGLQADIKGRHVILVEDIVDTGLTMAQLIKTFLSYQPASLSVATLFVKPDSLKVELPLQYKGFEIENKFIVGYGLDYNGLGRNYPDVYQKID